MMFDVRWHMFVVRMGRSQVAIVRMWLRVIPVKPFIFLFDDITILQDLKFTGIEVKRFRNSQCDVIGKVQYANDLASGRLLRMTLRVDKRIDGNVARNV